MLSIKKVSIYEGPFSTQTSVQSQWLLDLGKEDRLGFSSFLPTIAIDFLLTKLKLVRRETPNDNRCPRH